MDDLSINENEFDKDEKSNIRQQDKIDSQIDDIEKNKDIHKD